MFCKFKKGSWCEVGDPQAREKVSALLRDLLHYQYRSSAKAKIGRRSTIKQHFKRVDDTDDSDDSSTTSLSWGSTKESLGFEYWLEEPDDFFEIDVF
jgi:hypothetical protein